MEMIVRDGAGNVLARAGHPEEVLLALDHVWAEGDCVEITALKGSHLWLRMNAAIPEGEVYCPDGHMVWRVPSGERRLAYAPLAFDSPRNILSSRVMSNAELKASRDIARNPLDLRGDTDFFPHCTANVETRDESVFAARNVIDGLRYNTYHGEWPFESWGIGAREDAWCRLDIGREVVVERMALTLRADFPHDAYWGFRTCGGFNRARYRLRSEQDRGAPVDRSRRMPRSLAPAGKNGEERRPVGLPLPSRLGSVRA